MPNKYQALAEPFKLMDKAIEDFNKSTDSMFEVKQQKHIAKGYRFKNTTLKKELKFLRLPLNERLEQEYINKRENEDKQKETE